MDKNGVTVCRPEHPRKPGRLNDPQKQVPMILTVCVKLNKIYEQGRNFPWIRPHACPRCTSARVWGHGFVLAYFDGFAKGIWLRRFRCPDCNCIVRMKPKGYFPRFQVPIDIILAVLTKRLSGGKWDAGLSASRQRHWLCALKRKTMAFFGFGFDLMAAFYRLMNKGIVPVSRAV